MATMTVEKLREILKDLPGDMPVLFGDDGAIYETDPKIFCQKQVIQFRGDWIPADEKDRPEDIRTALVIE